MSMAPHNGDISVDIAKDHDKSNMKSNLLVPNLTRILDQQVCLI